MRMIVCVKQVPASNETRLDPVTHTLIRDGAQGILNPFDAYAVETAIRLKESFGGTITALSMGVPAVRDTLKRVVAVGADEALLLTDRAFAGSDTLATARALAGAVRRKGLPDLILCGRMASDGDTAQVGPMLAELLDIPHLTDVAAIESLEAGRITVRRLTDEGYLTETASLPVLITVLKEICVPRLPSVSGILRGEETEVCAWSREDTGVDANETGLTGSRTKVVRSMRPSLTVETQFLLGSPIEQAQALLDILRKQNLMTEGTKPC